MKAEVGMWILLCEKRLDWITEGPSGCVPSCESRATVFILKPPKSATGLGPAPGGSCGILPDIQDWKWHHHLWISTFQMCCFNHAGLRGTPSSPRALAGLQADRDPVPLLLKAQTPPRFPGRDNQLSSLLWACSLRQAPGMAELEPGMT